MEAVETEELSILLGLPSLEQEKESTDPNSCQPPQAQRTPVWKLVWDILVRVSFSDDTPKPKQVNARNDFSESIYSSENVESHWIKHSTTHAVYFKRCRISCNKQRGHAETLILPIPKVLARELPCSEKSRNAAYMIESHIDECMKEMKTSEKEIVVTKIAPLDYLAKIDKVLGKARQVIVSFYLSAVNGEDYVISKDLDLHFEAQNDTEKKVEAQQLAENDESQKEILEKRITSLKCEAKQSLSDHKKQVDELLMENNSLLLENNSLKAQIRDLKKSLQVQKNDLEQCIAKKEKELHETLLQFGSLSVEHDKIIKESMKKDVQTCSRHIVKTSHRHATGSSSAESEPESGFDSGEEEAAAAVAKPAESVAKAAVSVAKPAESVTTPAEAVAQPAESSGEVKGAVGQNPIHEESSNREGISLGNVPTAPVERSLYYNYKTLLIIIAQSLLSDQVAKLRDWAGARYAIDSTRDVNEIFGELDRQRIISASDLKILRQLFENILRFDLVHLIDCFMLGDYSCLRNAKSSAFPRNGIISSGRIMPRFPLRGAAIATPRLALDPTSHGKNPGVSFDVFQNCSVVMADSPANKHDVDVQRQPSTTESRIPTVHSTANHGTKLPDDMGSNGRKLSKLAKSDSKQNGSSNPQNNSGEDSGDDDNEKWLCSHYKRRCHVKFACCEKYWPCHRCHNNESDCGQKKLKSIHTKFVKCVKCLTEQEFNETSQFCINCHTKFAKYFCPTCKHLTGKDDNPYHCEQCGICRIHEHRSFHCDTCGVCLDVQLRDNHKCREGSAHDECCICLEDAFTGCQILPCSHKVHKECATRMIRNGITRCPICRESFAHKLEKRPGTEPSPMPKKFGKM